jgi:hypothetical protein
VWWISLPAQYYILQRFARALSVIPIWLTQTCRTQQPTARRRQSTALHRRASPIAIKLKIEYPITRPAFAGEYPISNTECPMSKGGEQLTTSPLRARALQQNSHFSHRDAEARSSSRIKCCGGFHCLAAISYPAQVAVFLWAGSVMRWRTTI